MRRRRPRTTLALAGQGVHTGRRSLATIEPGRWGHGLRIAAGPESWQVDPASVQSQPGCSRIGRVATIEHALAALVLLGITDATIRTTSSELPILDGSAKPWVRALHRIGIEDGPTRPIWPSQPVDIHAAGGRARWTPGSTDRVIVHVAYDGGPVGSAAHTLTDPPPPELIAAQTFALGRDLARLRRAGRGRGADPTNTAIHGPSRPSQAAVRHLLLDALGDRAQGGLVRGEAELWHPSHALSAALWRAVARTRG